MSSGTNGSEAHRLSALDARVGQIDVEIRSLRESRHAHAQRLTVHEGQIDGIGKHLSSMDGKLDEVLRWTWKAIGAIGLAGVLVGLAVPFVVRAVFP